MSHARFVRTPRTACGWQQYITPKDRACDLFRFRSWDGYTIDQVKPILEKVCTNLDIECGPL